MLRKDPRVLICALTDSFKRLRRKYFKFDYPSRLTLGILSQTNELVIGNFANRNIDPKTLTYMSLNVRADFGNGVKLFSIESK